MSTQADYSQDKIDINIYNELITKDSDYWSFKEDTKRQKSHVYFNYPAMMVPAMQSELISCIVKNVKDIKTVLDPFAGSGTVMAECMYQGLSFQGIDINPLAILLCKAKKGPFYEKAIKNKIDKLINQIDSDERISIDVSFVNRDKWFTKEVLQSLSRVRRAILEENMLWARRFFWVAFGETIRQSSNSRTSTFKLHIRTKEDIESREIDVIEKFKSILLNNYEHFCLQKSDLENAEMLSKGAYKNHVKIHLNDSAKKITCLRNKKFDLIISSPPYGDNHTTVTYGQFSYLPLQFIPTKDIDNKIPLKCLNVTTYIDKLSLGGSASKDISDKVYEKLFEVSPTLKKIIAELSIEHEDKTYKVINFYEDLRKSLKNSLSVLRKDGYMVWTVGNRCVGGISIPLDKILQEILEYYGSKLVLKLDRDICNKRMANRNKSSDTMTKEEILILRKTN